MYPKVITAYLQCSDCGKIRIVEQERTVNNADEEALLTKYNPNKKPVIVIEEKSEPVIEEKRPIIEKIMPRRGRRPGSKNKVKNGDS